MGNNPRAANPLPQELSGRGTMGGPLAGGYIVISASVAVVGAGLTDSHVATIPHVMSNLRVHAVVLSTVASGASNTIDLRGESDDVSLFTQPAELVGGGSVWVSAVNAAAMLVEASRTRRWNDNDMTLVYATTSGTGITQLDIHMLAHTRGHLYGTQLYTGAYFGDESND